MATTRHRVVRLTEANGIGELQIVSVLPHVYTHMSAGIPADSCQIGSCVA
jgi:hypothetical protein